MTSAAHPLFARGILRRSESSSEWTAQISMPLIVAATLEGLASQPPELTLIAQADTQDSESTLNASCDLDLDLLASRMADPSEELRIVPVPVALDAEQLNPSEMLPAF